MTMILNNINNLIIMTESELGDALLIAVKHGGKQFGRGMTDIFHLGKFKDLKAAADDLKTHEKRYDDTSLKLDSHFEKSIKLHRIARALEKRLQNASDSVDVNELKNSINRANTIAKQRTDAVESGWDDLNKQHADFMARYHNRVDPLQKQLDLTDAPGGKLARKAGRATAGIAATGGTVAGINAATNKLAASNNKEESK